LSDATKKLNWRNSPKLFNAKTCLSPTPQNKNIHEFSYCCKIHSQYWSKLPTFQLHYNLSVYHFHYICMPKTRKLASLVRKGYKHSKFTELTAFSPAQIFLSGCVNVEIFAHLFSKKEKEKENATQVEYENISFSPRVIKSCIEKFLFKIRLIGGRKDKWFWLRVSRHRRHFRLSRSYPANQNKQGMKLARNLEIDTTITELPVK